MSEIILCMICKKQLKRVTQSHLKKHNLTIDEYLINNPTAKLFSDDLRHSYGKGARENNPMYKQNVVEKVRDKLTGVPKTKNHKLNLSNAKKGISWGKHTDAHKKYMEEVSRKNMQNRLVNGWRSPEWSRERKNEQSIRMMGNKRWRNSNHNKGETLSLSDEQRKNRSNKRRAFLSSNKNLVKTSSLETQYASWCDSHDLSYESQFVIQTSNGKWLFDFYLPKLNLLVELDGEYWHCTKKALARDIIKTKLAKEHGFILLRLSDRNLNFSLTLSDTKIILEHSEMLLTQRQLFLEGKGIP